MIPQRCTRVLMLAGRFELRGSSTQTLHLARFLRPTVGVQVLCSDASRIPEEFRAEMDLKVVSYLDWSMLRSFAWRMIGREIKAHPPDIIHIQQRKMHTFGAWLARYVGCPYLVTVHDYLDSRETLTLDPKWGRGVIAVSDSVRDELIARTGISPQLVHVIPSGVAIPDTHDSTAILEGERFAIVGTAGPLEAAKGLTFFLRAAADVVKEFPQTLFLIAGAGPEERALRRLTRRLGIQKMVTFVPNMLDFSTSLDAMDVFVLPSLKQGLGTIMLEAMARGRPVIATSAGGVYSAVTDDVTGCLVPPSDSDALATRIKELLRDPQRARAIGTAAREHVERHFRVSQMVDATIDLYRQIEHGCDASPAQPHAADQHRPA